jgi:hypothetical protein
MEMNEHTVTLRSSVSRKSLSPIRFERISVSSETFTRIVRAFLAMGG